MDTIAIVLIVLVGTTGYIVQVSPLSYLYSPPPPIIAFSAHSDTHLVAILQAHSARRAEMSSTEQAQASTELTE